MKKLICAFLVIACLIPLTVGCSKYDEDYVYDGHSLVGKWMEKKYDEEYYVSYEFSKDGVITLKEYNYGIEVSSTVGTYTVEDKNLLVAKYVNYDGTVQHVENRFSMKEDMIVMLYLDHSNQMEEKEMILVPFDVDFNEGDEDLYGEWYDTENKEEFWRFNKDFTGSTYNGTYEYSIKYSVNGRKIYVAYESIPGVVDAIVELKYKINGDTLTIKGEGVELTLERK